MYLCFTKSTRQTGNVCVCYIKSTQDTDNVFVLLLVYLNDR